MTAEETNHSSSQTSPRTLKLCLSITTRMRSGVSDSTALFLAEEIATTQDGTAVVALKDMRLKERLIARVVHHLSTLKPELSASDLLSLVLDRVHFDDVYKLSMGTHPFL